MLCAIQFHSFPAFDPNHFIVGIASQMFPFLPLLLKSAVTEVASWQDIPALCQVAGKQVLFDAPVTLIAAFLQSVVLCFSELEHR